MTGAGLAALPSRGTVPSTSLGAIRSPGSSAAAAAYLPHGQRTVPRARASPWQACCRSAAFRQHECVRSGGSRFSMSAPSTPRPRIGWLTPLCVRGVDRGLARCPMPWPAGRHDGGSGGPSSAARPHTRGDENRRDHGGEHRRTDQSRSVQQFDRGRAGEVADEYRAGAPDEGGGGTVEEEAPVRHAGRAGGVGQERPGDTDELAREERRTAVVGQEGPPSSISVAAQDLGCPAAGRASSAPAAQREAEVVAGDGPSDHHGRQQWGLQSALARDGCRQQDSRLPRNQQADEGAGLSGCQDEHDEVRPPSGCLDDRVQVHDPQPTRRVSAGAGVWARAGARTWSGTTRPCGSQASAGR
ncbi:hypothetical protein FB570_111133 [Streptomyces sp. T12]|nr:hypothetical protein FB570_111133 [Streptomyces sp. T12]